SREWKISTGHLAERYSLFMLITMGETIISLGEGATKAPMTPLLIAAVLISFVLIVILLRHYYTEVLDAGERRLHEISGASLVRFARYGYTYLHLAMVAGLLLAAVALKAAMKDLTTPLDDILEACLAAGVGLFLLATTLFSALAKEPWRRLSILAVVVLAILTVVGPRIPTIALIILVVIAAAIGVDPRSLGGRIPRYLSRDA
ncbi:MAG: low temperature requirement protein A, partial [Candidatus Nanopelagicales bacterium]